MNEIGKKQLKIALIRNNMNITKLAEAVGMSKNTLYRKIRVDDACFSKKELLAIRDALHLSADEFMGVFFAPDEQAERE